MNITDELRGFADNWDWLDPMAGESARKLRTIADRINAEVKGMVELPKDADDVPWNVGDHDEDGNEITELRLTSDGWFVVTDGKWPHRPETYRPKHKHHNYVLTVEDVMVEFATDWEHKSDYVDRAALLKEYASKLQLTEVGAYE